MIKKSIKQIIALLLSLSILTLLTSQSRWGLAQTQELNLIDYQHIWKPFSAAIISQNDTHLNIVVVTYSNQKIWSRAFLLTQINSTIDKPLHLTLNYLSVSLKGNATFFAEIRDNSSGVRVNSSSKILWHQLLNNTSGQLSNETFTLPSNIVNRPVELRLYAITNNPGEHILAVKKATLIIP